MKLKISGCPYTISLIGKFCGKPNFGGNQKRNESEYFHSGYSSGKWVLNFWVSVNLLQRIKVGNDL
jgi:hypothetical protein